MDTKTAISGGIRNTGVPLPGHGAILRAVLERSFAPLFKIYVYLLILLPSGSLFGVNVKVLCFLLLLPPACHRYFKHRQTTQRRLALLLVIPACLAAWILIGQIYSYSLFLSLSEFKDIWTTLISAWVAAVYCGEEEGKNLEFVKMVISAEVVSCILKFSLLGYCFGRGLSVALMVDQLNAFFGVNLMGMDFESALGRIQFVADSLIPICIYALLRYRNQLRLTVGYTLVLFALLINSLIFSFSRYLWAFGVFAFCLGLIFSKKDRLHAWILGLLGAAILAALPLLIGLYQLRFAEDVAGSSDSVRTLQVRALEQFFWDAPLFGHGLGSYSPEIIRSEELPYVYEVQLYALAGQFGVVGTILLGILTAYYFEALWPNERRSFNRKANLAGLLILWLLAGLFNPMLLNSAAAMSYAAIRALAFVNDRLDPFSPFRSGAIPGATARS